MEKVTSEAKIFLTFFLLTVFIYLLDTLNVLTPPKHFLLDIFIPIQYGLYHTSKNVTSQFDVIYSLRFAAKENQALKRQLADLLSENSKLRQELSSTKAFTQQADFLNPQTYNVISTIPINIGRFITIDKGSNEGIREGMPVVFKDSLIGTIHEVEPSRSKVMLISDPESKISCFLSNSSGNAKGILVGEFQADLLIDKILHQEPVSVGEIVYSSGTDSLPRGLILGVVSEVLDRDNEIFKQAKVNALYDPYELDHLFIITN